METTRPNVPTYPRGQLKLASRLNHGDEIPQGLVTKVGMLPGRLPADGNRKVIISVIGHPEQQDPDTIIVRSRKGFRVKTW